MRQHLLLDETPVLNYVPFGIMLTALTNDKSDVASSTIDIKVAISAFRVFFLIANSL